MSVQAVQTVDAPTLSIRGPVGPARGVVLVLPGGKADSFEPADPRQLTALRMRPLGSRLFRSGARLGLAVATVRYRYRGWNGAAASPVADVAWALAQLRARYPEIPVVLLGHSMGGRAAIRAAGEPAVRGVVALAPWLPASEPDRQLAGRQLLVAHGNLDVVTSPKASLRFAERASRVGVSVARAVVWGDSHAMLTRWSVWHRLAVGGCLSMLDLAPPPRAVKRLFDRGAAGDFSVWV